MAVVTTSPDPSAITISGRTTTVATATTTHTAPAGLPPGFGASTPEPAYTAPAARSVNHLVGMLNDPTGFGSGEGSAELLSRHTVGSPPPDQGMPRRVVVGGETAVIGRQHRAEWFQGGAWVRFDWLRTYPHVHTLARALEDPRFRPDAVADFGGGRFIRTKSCWSESEYDSAGFRYDAAYDHAIERLLFVPAGGGVAIDIGCVSYNDDGKTDHAEETRFLLGAYGLTHADVADTGEPRDDFDCVLTSYGIEPLEMLFG